MRNQINTSVVSDDKARLLATEIIAQGNMMSDAVKKIRLRGFSENQISFLDANNYSTWTNTNCATTACQVFDAAGGNIIPPAAPPSSQTTSRLWGFTSTFYINNIGTASGELIAGLPDLKLEVCNQINKILGVPSIYVRTSNPNANRFGNGAPTVYTASPLPVSWPYPAACVQFANLGGAAFVNGINNYFYYQVLIAR